MNFKKHLIWLTSDDKEDVFSRKEQTKKKPVRLSTKYLNWLLYACLTVKFWMNLWLLYFLPLLLICLIVKKIASYLGVLRFVRDRTTTVKNAFINWVMRRKVVLCPTPVHGLWRIIVQCDSKFSSWIEGSIDTFSSLTVIVILLVTMTIGFLLITVQVYWEAVQLTRVTKEMVNKTILSKPVIQKYFPKSIEDVHEGLNVVVDHAYGYGKKAINKVVCKLAGGEDEEQVALTKKQFSDIWNQLYQLWYVKYSGTSEIEETVSWSTVLDGLSNLDMTPFIKCVKNDMMIMLKFLKSCWMLVKENLVIVYHLFRSIVRILFHSSRAILNFILGLVIFTTALFYLLLISGETYKPVEVISRLLPSCEEGTRVGNLMKSAIQGVFHASFKKAAIYTLYTWLIHTVFQVMLVYIPTIFAGFCGLVPFLEIYWACIPAVLELWLIKDQPIKAALMFGCQLIPIFFVDGLIQEEIKGTGHPYLTGMAIAGGIMCMGVKGAFLGPMLLCFLIVAINMYTAWLRGVSPSVWKTTKKKEMISIDKDTPQDLDSQSKTTEGVSFDADNYQEGKIIKCDAVIPQDLDSQSKMNEGVSFDADNYQEGKIIKCDAVIPQDLDSQSKTNEGVSFDADNYQEGKIIKCDAVIPQDLDCQSKTNEGVSFDADNYQEGEIIKCDAVIPQDLDSQSKTKEGVSFEVESFQEERIIKVDTDTFQNLDILSKTEKGVSFDVEGFPEEEIIKVDTDTF
ncbi:transmembrane protein 245-like isoform X2 [Tachypleus tridentatus]